jgi:homoserine O-acetyltransferase
MDWIDAPHYQFELGDFMLESGQVVQDFSVSFAVHGGVDAVAKPLVLALCAIGSTHHRLDFLIGPGCALDTNRCRIIAIDAIGNGLTTSPSNSKTQPGMEFPRFSIRDMVRSQQLLLEQLGIKNPIDVIGASMGGMQALQWAVDFPDAVRRVIALTPMAKTAAWAGAINHAARQSLFAKLGENPRRGDYPASVWDGWTPIMQMLAMRTPAQVDHEFPDAVAVHKWLHSRAIWWREQGFDPIDWIYQSWAYDAHNVGADPRFGGDTAFALSTIRAKTLIVVPTLDLYNPIGCAAEAARNIREVEFHTVKSNWGHLMASASDGQASNWLNQKIRQFLE